MSWRINVIGVRCQCSGVRNIVAGYRAAFDFGFDCEIIHDACATRNLEFGGTPIPAKEVHGSFMAALGSAYSGVMTWDEYRKSH